MYRLVRRKRLIARSLPAGRLNAHSYSVRNAVTGFANAAFTAW
jgi:hypothetical protein